LYLSVASEYLTDPLPPNSIELQADKVIMQEKISVNTVSLIVA